MVTGDIKEVIRIKLSKNKKYEIKQQDVICREYSSDNFESLPILN